MSLFYRLLPFYLPEKIIVFLLFLQQVRLLILFHLPKCGIITHLD